MHNQRGNMTVWVLVVMVVVAILVYISFFMTREEKTTNTETNTEVQGGENQGSTEDTNGVSVTVLTNGTGVEAKAGDLLSVNYTGSLEGGKVFDSNILSEFGHVTPFEFTLGAGQVIKGWDVGLLGMKVGEKRMLKIEPEYGYGAYGAGSAIPPNAVLYFEVELLGIKN